MLNSVLLAVLVLSGLGVGLGLFPGRDRCAGSRVLLTAFIGLLALTFVYIVLVRLGLENRGVMALSLVMLGVLGYWRCHPEIRVGWEPTVVVLGAFIAIPTLLQGLMMSGGEFPDVFFNVDTAFYLQFVHSFLENGQYPPPRLDNYQLPAFGYHYGVMALGALISEFTGTSPHTAFLLFVPVIGVVALIAAANELLKVLSVHRAPVRGLILFVFFSTSFQLDMPTVSSEYIVNLPLDAVKHWIKEIYKQGVSVEAGTRVYGMQFASLYGHVLCFFVVSLTLREEYRRSALGYILAVALMPIVKTPYMAFVALGVGGYSLYRFWATRDYGTLVVPVLAGAGMLFVFYLFGAAGSISRSSFSLDLGGSLPSDQIELFAVLGVACPALLLVSGLRRQVPAGWKRMLWFVVPLLVFGLAVEVDHGDTFQMFSTLSFLAYLYLPLITARGVDSTSRVGVAASGTVLFALVMMGAWNIGTYSGTLLSAPEEGTEYADNRALADVLQHIPIRESLIVTNDLRYPAEGFARDKRQFQISALFGHLAFNAELTYSRSIQESTPETRRLYRDRLMAQKLFTSEAWNKAVIEHLVSRYPITHFVVHRTYPHPRNIPLPIVAENDQYVVYRFRNQGGG